MRWRPKEYHIHRLLAVSSQRLLLLCLPPAQQVHVAAGDRGGAGRRKEGAIFQHQSMELRQRRRYIRRSILTRRRGFGEIPLGGLLFSRILVSSSCSSTGEEAWVGLGGTRDQRVQSLTGPSGRRVRGASWSWSFRLPATFSTCHQSMVRKLVPRGRAEINHLKNLNHNIVYHGFF